MPILAKGRNEYAIALTYACNWKCPYCAVDNKHDKRDGIDLDDIMQRVSQVSRDATVTLTGGEPGLVKREWLEACIRAL